MNTMQFAHFIAKRDRATGSRLTYRQCLARALQDAYRLIKRGVELVAEVAGYKALDRRIAGEKAVARAAVRQAIKLGYVVSLYDGEEWSVKGSNSEQEVMANLYATDEEVLSFRDNKEMRVIGKIWLVYGNSASEVMSDWSDNEQMAKIMAPAIRRADRYAELGL